MSFTSWKYHIVFSTKYRQPLLRGEVKPRLIAYIAGIITNLRGVPEEINGSDDHLHVFFSLGGNPNPVAAARDIKANSSRWIHQTFPDLQTFGWQNEYAGFTVSLSATRTLKHYIQNQEEHHKKTSFIDELKWLLEGYGIKFDERYLQ